MKPTIILAALAVAACSSPIDEHPVDAAHTSQNALDWHGSYTGTIPCADCEGIRTTITLQPDGTFTRERIYQGRSYEPVRDIGSFSWDDRGGVITLAPGSDSSQQYQVGENRLLHLDQSGNRIAGDLAEMYVLEKTVRDPRFEDRRWVLAAIGGQELDSTQERQEAFITFDSEEGRFSGNASCNNFFGNYVLLPGNRFRSVGGIGATRMACPDMQVESRFLEALETIDNYAVDDDRLILNLANMAPILQFQEQTDRD